MCSGTSSLGRATSPRGKSGKSRTSDTRSSGSPPTFPEARAALVGFRPDPRVHARPPLRAALAARDTVIPVFALEQRLLDACENRASFLYAALPALRASLRQRGGDLVVLRGAP